MMTRATWCILAVVFIPDGLTAQDQWPGLTGTDSNWDMSTVDSVTADTVALWKKEINDNWNYNGGTYCARSFLDKINTVLDGADQFFFGKQVTNPVKLLYGESFTGHNIIISEGLTASLELGTVMHEAIHHFGLGETEANGVINCVHNASDDDDDANTLAFGSRFAVGLLLPHRPHTDNLRADWGRTSVVNSIRVSQVAPAWLP